MAEIRPYGSPSFDFNFTLKILQVPITADFAVIQDLWNAIVKASADLQSMDDEEIATISGKEPLGGGQFVGITLSLINGWRVQFAPRPGPDFVTVTVSGGNLVTSEADQAPAGGPTVGAATNPIAPAAFVTVTIAQSVSGTLSDRQDIDNKYLIESQRKSHQANGDSYYWDPVNGDDSKDGQTPSTARATFTSIHDDLVQDSHHDVIFAIPGDPNAITVATENIVISKRFTFLRGPGFDFQIDPASQTADTIEITADGVEVHGIRVTGPSTSGEGIHINGVKDFRIASFTIDGGRYGIYVNGAVGGNGRITSGFVLNTSDDGIHVEDSTQWEVEDVTVHDCGGDGLSVSAPSGALEQDAFVKNVRCFGNVGYGINIEDANVEDVLISNPALAGNTAGRLQDLGTNTTFSDDSERIRQIHVVETGRWEHNKAAGKLYLYDDDGVTVLAEFDLLDDLGAANTTGENIFERVPV